MTEQTVEERIRPRKQTEGCGFGAALRGGFLHLAFRALCTQPWTPWRGVRAEKAQCAPGTCSRSHRDSHKQSSSVFRKNLERVCETTVFPLGDVMWHFKKCDDGFFKTRASLFQLRPPHSPLVYSQSNQS